METPQTILDFWFGDYTSDAECAKQQAKLWWRKDQDTDQAIRKRFESWVKKAADGELTTWETSIAGRLALIILTDQFPRNIYRDDPQAFEYDHLARNWCRAGLRDGKHRDLKPIQRIFFYLPLEHSEFLDDQRQSVQLYQQLLDGVIPADRDIFTGYVDFAQRHHDIVQRFGRFPHRNRILGRVSTPSEAAFLLEKGSSF